MKGAMLFSDVKSSSKLWAAHPKDMLELLKKHENYIRKTTAKYDSMIVKVMGDAFMIKFGKLEEALTAAIEIQMLFAKKPIKFDNGDQIQIQIRIGIASGELLSRKVVVQEHKMLDFFGSTVNIASRMESKVSEVGGFAFLGDNVPQKVLDFVAQSCNIRKVIYQFHCEPDKVPIRSERLIDSRECRDASQLHLEDRKEHITYSCTLK